eukprot:COSAG06_NODE_36488_length_446_cov_5.933718_1_plen_77_part_01
MNFQAKRAQHGVLPPRRFVTPCDHTMTLREAGYNGMRMKNNAICQDTTRRAQMARWRAAHPGYMAAAAREHKQRRAQ